MHFAAFDIPAPLKRDFRIRESLFVAVAGFLARSNQFSECEGRHNSPVRGVTNPVQNSPLLWQGAFIYGTFKVGGPVVELASCWLMLAAKTRQFEQATISMNVRDYRKTFLRLLTGIAATGLLLFSANNVFAAGTAVGTAIVNSATVDYDLGGAQLSITSNITTITVAERLDVVVTLQSGQVLVSANDVNQGILFTVTNTGNGSEVILLAMNSVIAGDDFDPTPAVPDIYFDSDASGDLSVGDVPYSPGVNDPNLAADASIDVIIVNDIPGIVVNGNIGRSELSASAATGTGAPGTVYALQGDGGTDAVVGASGAADLQVGEYLVSDVLIAVAKAQAIADPFGGIQPIPGATLTYTITVEVQSAGVATASVLRDPIPAFSTYVPGSITLNGTPLTDAIDADVGEFDTAVAPTVVVRLGDLTLVDGIQTIVFQVTID
jgi:uncharacterized repeat protein (TIGR01451 family)